MRKEISFPEHEYESIQNYLNKLGYCYTTRVYKELGKYKVGELYTAPWGDVLKIDEVKTYWKVSDRPFYDEMSDNEKIEIRKYSEDMGLPYEFIKFSKSTVKVKLLIPSDIYPEMLESFRHKQTISNKWIKSGDRYELTKVYEIREWSKEKRIWISQYLSEQMDRGGFVAGAFLDSQMVGFSCLDGILRGAAEKYVNLTMLFVDDDWRRKGIGKRLFQQMCLCAENMEADKIFISAIPSYDTISFYFNMGCSDAQYIIDSFVDTEDDRYLEYDLRKKT